MDLTVFEQLGLSQGETKVYLALLEIGQSTTGAISQQSGVHTSKVYPILDRLMKKGMGSVVIQGGVRYYSAADPSRLLSVIGDKRKALDANEETVKQLLPALQLRQKFAGIKQSVWMYEGIEGITSLYELMLDDWKKGDPYLVFTPDEDYQNDALNQFFKRHHMKRIERGAVVHVLALESQRAYYEREYAGIKNFVFRYTANGFPAGINIVGTRVATLLWKPQPAAFVVDSPFLVKSYRQFFEQLWKMAKK